jgi:hypothetical protein
LHILRSEPDEQVHELIHAVTPGEGKRVALYGENTSYDDLVAEIFSHDHVITWW